MQPAITKRNKPERKIAISKGKQQTDGKGRDTSQALKKWRRGRLAPK